jgi:hypothetical protein
MNDERRRHLGPTLPFILVFWLGFSSLVFRAKVTFIGLPSYQCQQRENELCNLVVNNYNCTAVMNRDKAEPFFYFFWVQ